jgi:branched-chain amino acid transport system ATP-binding protein
MSESPILRTENLCRHFGGLRAVDEVNLSIAEGKIHAIIGPNGAGKSTLFNLLCGRIRPSSGRVMFGKREIHGLPQHRIARLGIARSYQITTVFAKLSVLNNLLVAAQSHMAFNFWRPAHRYSAMVDESMDLLRMIGLDQKANMMAAHLSHGEQRHLDIAIAMRTNPHVLLLDEPTAGMSPVETEHTMTLIKALAKKLTIILVEHKLDMIMRISEYITVLHFGRVLATGTPAEIQANPDVQTAYLGSSKQVETPEPIP